MSRWGIESLLELCFPKGHGSCQVAGLSSGLRPLALLAVGVGLVPC